MHHEKLFTLLEEVHGAIAEGAGGVLSALRKARHSMEEILAIDSSLSRRSHQLEDAFYEIEDFAESVRQYKSRTDFSPGRLDDVQSRLSAIRPWRRNTGTPWKPSWNIAGPASRSLQAWRTGKGKRRAWRRRSAGKTEKEIGAVARELSEKRKAASADLQKKIESEPGQLGMPKVSFRVLIQDAAREGTPVLTPWGKDAIGSSSLPTWGSRSRSCAPSLPVVSSLA